MAPLTPRQLQASRQKKKSDPAGTVPIEQAIFTSAQTATKAGYQLVAWSPGISAEDARLLAVWGPAHDSMIFDGPADVSLNFHPLGKEKFCISRTMLGCPEYSGRGGLQVYTHCFVIEASGFHKFQNDPFRVLAAALAIRDLRPGPELPTDLPVLKMLPSGPPVEPALITGLDTAKQQTMVAWIHHVLCHPRLVFTGNYTDAFLAAFLNLMPVSVRPWLSFSTRLRYSPRRSFRLIGLAHDFEEQKKALRQEGCSAFSFDVPTRLAEGSRHPWATWIQVALCHGDPALTAQMIGELPAQVQLEDLSSLGDRLRLNISSKPSVSPTTSPTPISGTLLNVAESADLLRLIDRSLEGEVVALEQFHALWQSSDGAPSHALRQQCTEHLTMQLRQRQGPLGEAGAAAVEILRLILAMDR